MVWTDTETRGATSRVGIARPTMLQNGLATERHLLTWIRTLLYIVTFGILMANVVLHLWHRRGDVWKDSAGWTWVLCTTGFALIALGSAVLVLGVITGGIGIRHWHSRGTPGRALISLAVAAVLGFLGLVTVGGLLFHAWPQ